MAVNLRNKIDPSYKILICDVAPDAISKYQVETQGKGTVEVISNGFEAAKAAVSSSERERTKT